MQTLILHTTRYFGACIRALMHEWTIFKHDPFMYERSFDEMIWFILLDKDDDVC